MLICPSFREGYTSRNTNYNEIGVRKFACVSLGNYFSNTPYSTLLFDVKGVIGYSSTKNKFFGLGAGINSINNFNYFLYNKRNVVMIPLTIESYFSFFNTKIRPVLSMVAGYGFCFNKNPNAFIFYPQLGLKKVSSDKKSFTFNIGIKYLVFDTEYSVGKPTFPFTTTGCTFSF